MDRNIDPRKFIKGETKQLLMTASDNFTPDAAIWGREYAFFKIVAVNVAGIAPGSVVRLLSGEKYVFLNNTELTIAPSTFLGGFMWLITPMCGLDHLQLELDGSLAEDVIFQITPYEEAQTT